MARDRIGSLGGGVIGITGSVGKTTTKDLVRACLASAFPTAASERSFNNELGLPLTLLNARGRRALGRARDGGARVRPHRPAGGGGAARRGHCHERGDGAHRVSRRPRRGGAGEERAGGRAAGLRAWRCSTSTTRGWRRCGRSARCPVLGLLGGRRRRGGSARRGRDARRRVAAAVPSGHARGASGDVRLSLPGVQQVSNTLAASAAALWCGVAFDAVVEALASVEAPALRMEVRRAGGGGPALIVDCYNANPASTEAALRSLAALAADRRVALLGLMAELGVGDRRRAPASGRAGRGAGDRGRRLRDRPLRRRPGRRRRRRGGAVARRGAGRRGAGQGQPGGPARGRRAGVRSGGVTR